MIEIYNEIIQDLLTSDAKTLELRKIFFISESKHMLWVLKRTVSLRRFF